MKRVNRLPLLATWERPQGSHQGIRMHDEPKAVHAVREDIEKPLPIPLVPIDRLALIAPRRHAWYTASANPSRNGGAVDAWYHRHM